MKWIDTLKKPAVVSFAGVLALVALVWFYGPLVAFDGRAPLDSAARRWLAVALIFLCWAGYWGVRYAKARIAGSKFVQGLVADALDPARREPDPRARPPMPNFANAAHAFRRRSQNAA